MLEFLSGNSERLTKAETLEIPTVSACISKIADTVSRLPVKLYRAEDGKVTEIADDRRIKLLNGETGDTLNSVDMWRSAIEDYFLGGGAWIFINSDGAGVKSLHYVDCNNVSLMQNNDPIFKAFRVMVNGVDYYDFQFIRFMRKTRDGYTNIPIQAENSSVLAASYNALKLENIMNQSGGCKSGFFKARNKLSDAAIASIRDSYTKLYNNKKSEKGIAVLNEGVEFQEISSTAAELQLNENKRANSIEICKIFGFPHTIIDGGASEGDRREFIAVVVALLNQIETALDEFLLLESEKKQGYYWAFDTKELTRGSLKERYEAYEIAVRNRILQIDEVRKEEDFEPLNLNFVTLGLGDVLLDTKTREIYTPNTNQTAKLGETFSEKRARGDNWSKDDHGLFNGSNSSVSGSLKLSDGQVIEFDGVLKYGRKDDTMNETVREKIESWEEEKANSKVEYGYAVSIGGRELGEIKGAESYVNIPKNFLEKGNTFTHIHPRAKDEFGGTFSVADLNNFAEYRVTTYRAKAKEGTYSISKTDNFDILGFKKYMIQSQNEHEEKMKKEQDELLKKLRSKKIGHDDFGKENRKIVNSYYVARHNDLLEGQEKYGYKYTLENNGGLKNG